jgi:2-keto-3-deoxy-L-fuconate dehydrogenase
VAIDYAADGIRVNAICPGTVRAPMTEEDLRQTADPEALLHTWERWHPLGRIGQPADIAYAALYLASDESAWVTGQILMDGGFTV